MTIGRTLWSAGLTVALAVALATGGCATTGRQDAPRTEDLLADAGFRQRPADTPEKQAQLKAMLPLLVISRMQNGQLIYTYADPYGCKCVYVGTPENHQAYENLTLEQRTAGTMPQGRQSDRTGRDLMEQDLWSPWQSP